MWRRQVFTSMALLLALGSAPAHGCEYEMWLFQLPGETEAQAQARSDTIDRDSSVIRHYLRETSDLRDAKTIFLGQVVSKPPATAHSGRTGLPSSTVVPIASFKGALPTTPQTLIDELQGGMCGGVGDGAGAFGSVGDRIVVFEGLPKSTNAPGGIDSFPVSAIRTEELLDWLRQQGKDLDR